MTQLHILSENISIIDMLVSFATYCHQSSTRCVKPEIVKYSTAPITFRDATHPIFQQISYNKFIPNTISIQSSRNIQIITGPNNSGKTTYIKQAAILLIMGCLGCFIPSQIASIKLLDQIFTRLSHSDNLALNQSSYFKECKDINYILRNCTKNSLIIIDAYAFGWSCLEHIKKIGAYTLFVTHFDFTKLIKIYPNVVSAQFKMQIEDNKVEYSYKIKFDDDDEDNKKRKTKDYGIIMAEMTGFPQHIINDSKNTLNCIKSISDFNDDNNNIRLSEYETALVLYEHTASLRAANQTTKEQQIEVLSALQAILRESF